MGRFAAQTLLNTDASIASLRGRVHRYAERPLIVTYHPSAAIRFGPNGAPLAALQDDLARVADLLAAAPRR